MLRSTPDARALGHLLLLQGGIQLVDTEAQLVAIVSRGLGRVPGIAAAEVCLAPAPGPPRQSPRALGARIEVPLHTLRQQYGCLAIDVSDPSQYAPYEPFVRNLAGTIALWLESQSRRAELEETLQRLEAALRDRSQALQEAHTAVRLRETILAVVSHDLRNPLASIASAAAVLKRTATAAPGLEKAALAIERCVHRMNRLIRDLLDLASIDAGRLSIELAPHDIGALVAEALDDLRPTAARKPVAVEAVVAGDLPALACDGHRVVQVISNLLGNAIKFTPPGGTVSLAVERRAEELLVTVSDTGPGIAEADLPRLFERYYRGQDVREPGTGLGLTIAKALVDLHHGRIGVESTRHVGSKFFFTLPLVEPRPGAAPARGPEGNGGRLAR